MWEINYIFISWTFLKVLYTSALLHIITKLVFIDFLHHKPQCWSLSNLFLPWCSAYNRIGTGWRRFFHLKHILACISLGTYTLFPVYQWQRRLWRLQEPKGTKLLLSFLFIFENWFVIQYKIVQQQSSSIDWFSVNTLLYLVLSLSQCDSKILIVHYSRELFIGGSQG